MRTLYVNGRVFTGTEALQSAFAVEDGRFLSVGSDEQVLALCREGAEPISPEIHEISRSDLW